MTIIQTKNRRTVQVVHAGGGTMLSVSLDELGGIEARTLLTESEKRAIAEALLTGLPREWTGVPNPIAVEVAAHANSKLAELIATSTDMGRELTRLETDLAAAVARAEKAERELADPYSQANQDAIAWNRVRSHPALRMDLLPEADHTYAGSVFERITWLAETAEAVNELTPTPAVSRADIEKAIRGAMQAAGATWNRRTHRHLIDAVQELIKAGEAVDPVKSLAEELFEVAWSGHDDAVEWGGVHESIHEQYRAIAAHVLGLEADQ